MYESVYLPVVRLGSALSSLGPTTETILGPRTLGMRSATSVNLPSICSLLPYLPDLNLLCEQRFGTGPDVLPDSAILKLAPDSAQQRP